MIRTAAYSFAEMPQFTADNAAAMAKRAQEAKQRKKREAQEQGNRAQLPAESREELEIVEEQITRTRKTLNDETPWCPCCERVSLEPHHRAQLLRALDGLLERRRKLTGRFSPGTLRNPEKPAKPSSQFQPAAPHEIPETDPGVSANLTPGEPPGHTGNSPV